MEWVKTINNAIEYMENHLTDDITLSDIAESVYISAFHFQREFSMMAGISPAEYLRNMDMIIWHNKRRSACR